MNDTPQNPDDYNGPDDFARSIDDAYISIRERVKNGGPTWQEKAKTYEEKLREAHLARKARLSPVTLTYEEHRLILRMREIANSTIPVASQDHVQRIVHAVGDLYGLRSKALLSKYGTRCVSRPRQVVCYLCYTLLPSLSLKEIGILLGRDLTTVFQGFNRVADRRKHDRELTDELTWLEGQFARGGRS